MRNPESERAALRVTDDFMAAFNARDRKAHFDTFHFPHVRIASGALRVFATRGELEANPERYGSREVIHAGPDKVHLAVQFTRYGADGRALNTYAAVYVIAKLDGRWGIQCRSSFAP